MKTSELRKMAEAHKKQMDSGAWVHDMSGYYAAEIVKLREALDAAYWNEADWDECAAELLKEHDE